MNYNLMKARSVNMQVFKYSNKHSYEELLRVMLTAAHSSTLIIILHTFMPSINNFHPEYKNRTFDHMEIKRQRTSRKQAFSLRNLIYNYPELPYNISSILQNEFVIICFCLM